MTAAAALFWSRPHRVFDLDGTLVDTLPDLSAALVQALGDLGLPAVGEDVVRDSLHSGLEGSAAAALASLGASAGHFPALVDRYTKRYAALNGLYARAYPGVRELLVRLRAYSVPIAVCTNKPEALACELLDRSGLLHHFAVVVGADTCDQRKPHPAPLLHALAAIGGEPQTSVLVGDSRHDVHCARAAGVASIFRDGGYGVAPVASPPRFSCYEQLLRAEPALFLAEERSDPALR